MTRFWEEPGYPSTEQEVESFKRETRWPQPEAIKCEKCWSTCPCVRWGNPSGQEVWSENGPPDPWDAWPSLYRCPVHGYIEVKDGKQVHDQADCWALGPDGKPMRLFEPERS